MAAKEPVTKRKTPTLGQKSLGKNKTSGKGQRRKKVISQKTAATKKSKAKRTTAARKKKALTTKKATRVKAATAKKESKGRTKSAQKSVKRTPSLGRPRLPGDAKLDLVFQKDYQAREIFAFLQVTTVRELEEFGSEQILEMLTGPMVQTVDRIRKALAINNRSLKSDRKFAIEFQKQLKTTR